jgi:hypothetical protein
VKDDADRFQQQRVERQLFGCHFARMSARFWPLW